MGDDLDDWNRLATTYMASAGRDNRFFRSVEPLLWGSLGDLSGKRVLDVGAGNGWLSHEMGLRGASGVAVDGSSALIAAGEAQYPQVSFIRQDLVAGLPPLSEAFDAAVSFMVLMDLPVIQPLINDIAGCLKATGKFVFVILHPCFFNFESEFDEASQTGFRKIDRYLEPEVWRLDTFGGHNHYHRSIGDYSEALRAAGLMISRLIEPRHIPLEHDCDFYRNIPLLLYIEAMKVDRLTDVIDDRR